MVTSDHPLIHYGSARGAVCGAPSGSLTLSTSLKLVTCPECIELKRPRTAEEDRILNQNLDRVKWDGPVGGYLAESDDD